MRKTAIALGITSLVLALGAGAQDVEPLELGPDHPPAEIAPEPEVPTPPYSYHFTRADRVVAAQACVHEATWAGATRTGDCGGIIQVVMERRRRGESFEEALARTMPRFYAGTTSRAWTRALAWGPLRHDPPGWPAGAPPASHYDDSWRGVNARIEHYVEGSEPLPCDPPPRQWFGRETDSEALGRAMDRGWCEARCGETRNAFLARCGAEGPGPSTAGLAPEGASE